MTTIIIVIALRFEHILWEFWELLILTFSLLLTVHPHLGL